MTILTVLNNHFEVFAALIIILICVLTALINETVKHNTND